MSKITDRIPFALHPVCGWIMMAADMDKGSYCHDMLYGWATAKDGDPLGPTWTMILEAIESERNHG